MERLNNDTLLWAFETCENCKDIRIGIACKDVLSTIEITHSLLEYIDKMPGWEIKIPVKIFFTQFIMLCNGYDGGIYIFNSDTSKMLDIQEYDAILFEDGISDALLSLLRDMEKPDSLCKRIRLPHISEQDEDQNDALNAFLNSFKII